MKDERDQLDGERILFWPHRPGLLREALHASKHPFLGHPVVRAIVEPLTDAAEAVIAQLAQHEAGQPMEFVRTDVPDLDRAALAKVLAAGKEGIGYMGYAECRICATRLGTRDLYGFGFMWPEKAEHYITEHSVWTPGCDKLLAVVRSRG